MADLCPNGFRISQLINLVRIYTPPKSGSHPIDPDCVVARETSPLSYSLTARSAVAKHPQVCTKGCGSTAASIGHGTRLRERKDCKQCRMYTVMPQSFQSFNIICIETVLSCGAEQHEVLWLDSSYHGSWDPAV